MDKLRLGIVGLGGMGANHLAVAKSIDKIAIAGVCDVNKEAVDRIAKETGAKGFCDSNEMFKSGCVDAVMVVTPHYFHTPITIAAFEAGIHVLTDKPIAVHKADAQKMLDAHAKRPELKFAAMFQLRTDSVFKKVKSLIETGELGSIKRINWIITNWFRSQSYYNSGGWRATWKGEGGGVLLNQCPHQLDLFQWFFGMPEKLRAFCHLGKSHNIEVEDDVTAYFEFANGATGVLVASTGDIPGTNRLEISCERGRLILENGKIKFNRTEVNVSEFIHTSDSGFALPAIWDIDVPSPGDIASNKKIIENFADAIIDNVPLIAHGEEGLNSVELANAMLYSSMNNTTIELPLDGAAYESMLNDLIKNSKFVKPSVTKLKDNVSASLSKK